MGACPLLLLLGLALWASAQDHVPITSKNHIHLFKINLFIGRVKGTVHHKLKQKMHMFLLSCAFHPSRCFDMSFRVLLTWAVEMYAFS